MISADLTGRAALVTGGASGIGLATVTRLAELGARVALNHLPGDPAGPAAAAALCERGLAVSAVAGDVAQPGAAEAMVGQAIAALGRLDFLVNNAGTPGTREPIPAARLEAMTEDFWQLILSTDEIDKSFLRDGDKLVWHGRPRGEERGGGRELRRAARSR